MSNNKLLDFLNNIQPEKEKLNTHRNSKVLIIDGLNTFLRSFAAVNHINRFGNHIGGLTGFLKSIGYAIDNIRPTRVIIVFDGEDGSVNKRYLYPEYKKNRDKTSLINAKMHLDKSSEEDSKINQVSRLIDYLYCLPVNVICLDKYEADDIIGYVATFIKDKYDDSSVVIMSTDNDFLQLVDDNISVYSPSKKKSYYINEVKEEFGAHPNNFLIYKSLIGDDSDNVKGIYGIGEKKAISLFPELRESEKISLNQILKISKNNSDKNKLYLKIIESKERLDINCKIMNLKKPNLSKDAIKDIKLSINSDSNNFNRLDFVTLHRIDDLDRSFQNVNVWLNIFNNLQYFKNK